MAQQRTTRDQKRAASRERARAEMAKQKAREKRNQLFVRGGVTVAVLAIFVAVGFGVWQASRPKDQTGPANMQSGGAFFTAVDGKAQVVETPGMAKGAKPSPTDAGKYDAKANIVTYLDLGCEYCKAFEDGNSTQIEDLVASGEATLEVMPVAITGEYAVRAGSAVSCLVAYQPESFFPMLKTMYANQPAEGGTLSNNQILDLWSNAGIDTSSDLEACVKSERYTDWIQTRTDTVTSDPKLANPASGGFGTPTILVNGKRYQPQNLGDPAEFAAFVKASSKSGSQ